MVSLPDGSQLTIVGIREAQFGRYDCLATSMAGTVSATAWIETQGRYHVTLAGCLWQALASICLGNGLQGLSGRKQT